MQEVYLYQTVHILGGRSLHLPAPSGRTRPLVARTFRPSGRTPPAAPRPADRSARGADGACGLRPLAVRADRRSCIGDPAFRLESAGISLYRGYDLRSLMPDAVTLQYDMPFPEAPTSAREAAAGLARQQARLHGASVAVRCDGDGIVRTADNAPLFAVPGKTAFVSPAEACVEQELGLRAVEAAGLELEERPVMRDELPRFDELFYVDHRGVTALAHCDGHPCMAILAERVAQSLAGCFQKSRTERARPALSSPENPFHHEKIPVSLRRRRDGSAGMRLRPLPPRKPSPDPEPTRPCGRHRTLPHASGARSGIGAGPASALRRIRRAAGRRRCRNPPARNKLRRLEAAARTATATKVEIRTPVRDTVVVRLSDTLVVRDTLRLFRWRDAWVRVEGAVTADSVLVPRGERRYPAAGRTPHSAAFSLHPLGHESPAAGDRPVESAHADRLFGVRKNRTVGQNIGKR